MKTIVCFDLDMTLLDHQTFLIPESSLMALEQLRGRYFIALATGRDMDTHYSRQFRDQIRPDGIIHSNGTRITVGSQTIYEHKMDKELLEQLLVFAQDSGYSVGATVGDGDYYTHKKQVEDLDIKRYGESGRQFKDVWELLEMDVRTLAYIGTPEGVRKLQQQFGQLKFLLFAGENGADIIEKQISKSKGLKQLCTHLGTDLKHCIAFGDSMNDYEMIRDAGIGVAMGNAIELIKETADYITTAVNCDGVWNACKHFDLIK